MATPEGWRWVSLEHADGPHIYRTLKFPMRGEEVDMLVLGYAWHLLSDQTKPEPSSLGALFCRATDVFAPRSLSRSR